MATRIVLNVDDDRDPALVLDEVRKALRQAGLKTTSGTAATLNPVRA